MVIALLLLAAYIVIVVATGRLKRIRGAKHGYVPLMLFGQVGVFFLGVVNPVLWAVAALVLGGYAGTNWAKELHLRNAQLKAVGAPTGPKGWRP